MSKISVMFNRPVTHSEIEGFREYFAGALSESLRTDISWHFTDDRKRIYLASEPRSESRILYQFVATVVETEFINLYGKAVRTYED